MTDQEKAERREKIRTKFKSIGQALINVGLPAVGGAISAGNPAAAQILKQVGKVVKVLGDDAEDYEVSDMDRIEAVIAQQDPEVMFKIRELETGMVDNFFESIAHHETQVTARHAADMSGDSTFARNFRPGMGAAIALAYIGIMIALTIMLFMSVQKDGLTGTSLTFASFLVGSVATLTGAVSKFYFGGRTEEKIANFKNFYQSLSK
jgi:hypothetical protein